MMDDASYITIPTNDNGSWTTTSFETEDDFRRFILSLFKEPGKYEFDNTSFLFNAEARKFNETKLYCISPQGTKDFVDYWDDQKEKNRKGCLFIHGDKQWYIPRDYYMWLNFLPIFNKEINAFGFAEVRDAQYHMSLYELLAELFHKHTAILKKRQIAASYYHCGKFVNQIWFEEGVTLKMGAALKDKINEKGNWKFLEEYRNFLNEHTAWYRPMNPGKVMMWQQQIEMTKGHDKRKIITGLKGTIQGVTFDKDPTAGTGGPCHRKGQPILMADGRFKNIEDISIGEKTLGIDNLPKKVLRKFNGIDKIYQVNQARGDSYYVIGDHILYLINRDSKVSSRTEERLTKVVDWFNFTKYKKKFFVGVKNNKPLVFHNTLEKVTLDPYFLGAWLGDGFRATSGLIVNKTKDPEIYNYLIELGKQTNTILGIRRKEKDRYNPEMYNMIFQISNNRQDSHFTEQFVKYNLFYNKHIPEEYLYSDINTRLQVLAGIIDTDGYYDPKKGHFVITSTNDKLADEIVILCRGLGAYVRTGRSCSKEHIVYGKTIKYSETNVIHVYFQDVSIIPTKVKRKKGNNVRVRNIHTSPISSIVPLEQEEYFGIEVEDSLYYLYDLTISHNCRYFYHEEAGIAPKMDRTYEYLLPALKSGAIYTGMFIAAGSVGDLTQCMPLKDMIEFPIANDIYPVETNLIDELGTVGLSGLFIPEQWSMPPYIDVYGNSLVDEALSFLEEEFARWKKELTPESYQIRISQHPRNIKEAFASRTVSKFSIHLIDAQERRIKDKEYAMEYMDIQRTAEGLPELKPTNKIPISQFPIRKDLEDKTGTIVIYERPIDKPEFGMYYASIDPVGVGKTSTTDSLCSIYIYKNSTEVTKINGDTTETYVEQGKIVAAWCGRFDDIEATHERLEMMLEIYNAWGLVENNIPGFITHMIKRRKQKYLVPKGQILFLKDIGANKTVYEEYGWKNTGTIFKTHMLSYGIEFLKEELDHETKDDGTIVRTTYGVERIPDIMLLAEMRAYEENGNFDRLVAYCSLVAFVKIQESNRGYRKQQIYVNTKDLDNSKKITKLNVSPFRHIGTSGNLAGQKFVRQAYKNLK